MFLFYLNPLIHRLNKKERVGYWLGDGEKGFYLKVLAFADDITLVAGSIERAARLWRIVQDWCRDTGSKYNEEKTHWVNWCTYGHTNSLNIKFIDSRKELPRETGRTKSLGIVLDKGDQYAHQNWLATRSKGRMNRIAVVCFYRETRSYYIRELVIPMWTHASLGFAVSNRFIVEFDRDMREVVFGKRNGGGLAIAFSGSKASGLQIPSLLEELAIARTSMVQRVLNCGASSARALYVYLEKVGLTAKWEQEVRAYDAPRRSEGRVQEMERIMEEEDREGRRTAAFEGKTRVRPKPILWEDKDKLEDRVRGALEYCRVAVQMAEGGPAQVKGKTRAELKAEVTRLVKGEGRQHPRLNRFAKEVAEEVKKAGRVKELYFAADGSQKDCRLGVGVAGYGNRTGYPLWADNTSTAAEVEARRAM